MDYAKWRACERFNMLPPAIKPKWNDNSFWHQALLIAYNQIREIEDAENIPRF